LKVGQLGAGARQNRIPSDIDDDALVVHLGISGQRSERPERVTLRSVVLVAQQLGTRLEAALGHHNLALYAYARTHAHIERERHRT